MTALELIADLARRDIRLAVRGGDRLSYDCPAGVMTSDLKQMLVARKQEVLAVLAGDWCAAAMALLDRVADPDLQADLRLRFEERAAIIEHDGGLPKSEAERLAYQELASLRSA